MVYTNIGGILMVNVTIYSIHGPMGYILTGILEIPRLASFQSHQPGVVPLGTNSLTIPLDTYHNQFTHFVVYTRSVAYEQTTPVGGQLNGATIQDPGSNTLKNQTLLYLLVSLIPQPEYTLLGVFRKSWIDIPNYSWIISVFATPQVSRSTTTTDW